MNSTKLTGISSITGKTVYIRHASEWDKIMLEHYLNDDMKEVVGSSKSDVVVAVEEGKIVGFGVLHEVNTEIGCVTMQRSGGLRGVDTYILRHLLENASIKKIYIKSKKPEKLKKLGFVEFNSPPNKYGADGKNLCHWQV